MVYGFKVYWFRVYGLLLTFRVYRFTSIGPMRVQVPSGRNHSRLVMNGLGFRV